ncbi:tetraacyldisaccharide 4'-kinase [endosymbiont of Acanthamoeba sp. UWC8]|uniref:tetraacyldisaccharide 4'-kinase n=1 Tax=endosymbiont of Acanthamoeba sp. UWC8 TaxID=86106 RepID=UPI0004D185B7|nr:tetraacyldisaccharide 4'-kinase [endosymbiont of Acanthamoeba sp. UWC8]AIF81788.1 tetraacyldisaccharide 4'-kinase [endosymbiont of Acanthamoeba sp. UWC8]
MKNLNRPRFWQQFNWLTLCLLPLSFIYRFIVYVKYIISKPNKMNIPVICVGNIVVGGAGKTPTVIAIAEFLQSTGKKVAIISRGYKGSLSTNKEATLVQDHSAYEVGDEALVLSKIASVYINRDRFLAALRAQRDGAEVIIMDDGLQNYTLEKDFSILVIDSNYGLGNHQLLPAGALRESLSLALKKADCIVYTGDGKTNIINTKLPTFTAKTIVKNSERLQDKIFIALCGIASPEKFFTTLKSLNITCAEKFIFGDHHNYSREEIEVIVGLANKLNLEIITTSKDIVKIPLTYHTFIEVVEIEYIFPNEFYNLISKATNKTD